MAISLSSIGQFALPQANINSDVTGQLAELGKALKDAQDKQEASQLLSKLGQTAPAQQPASGGGLLSSLGQSLGITSQPPPQQDTQSSAPVSNATVPNDSNALPGQVGMNLALADRTQDFIQDNPGTYMSSGVRSIADQQRLYDNRANNPNPVAVPGTSKHERGLAVDIGGMTPDQRATLAQYGLGQPVANDAPHVELAPDQQPQSPVRIASNSDAVPTASAATPAASYSNAQLAAMMQNPYTRGLATEIWKQKLAGKQYGFQVVNGRLVRTNAQSGTAEDATPAGMGSGYRPATAAEKDAYGVGDDSALLIGPDGKPQILNEGKADYTGQVKQRTQAAASLGLTPGSPAYQSFVLTGKMPREDAQPLTATDKKAILDSDEKVQATQQVIENLGKAKGLSKDAISGPGASQRGYLQSFLPSALGGDAGVATTDYNNLVTTNALTQLKTIFGGNPTEGERHILLDVQGSASQPDAVRQKILDRAIVAAQRRLAFEKQRADALRGGTFYKNGQQSPQPQVAPQQSNGAISQAQYNALPSGSVFTAPDGTQRVKP